MLGTKHYPDLLHCLSYKRVWQLQKLPTTMALFRWRVVSHQPPQQNMKTRYLFGSGFFLFCSMPDLQNCNARCSNGPASINSRGWRFGLLCAQRLELFAQRGVFGLQFVHL